ncbi:hypothetical protein NDU88_003368 [Pleurodeles waltl]|uniref:Uncharacterized protein n=1 Tax=Pleurodeles waltl TaxID=8319 RepID=A0AAV7UFY6_PLEWA|nr:hypothetical protein NDU88_003368 [Pleurodeles waltl]
MKAHLLCQGFNLEQSKKIKELLRGSFLQKLATSFLTPRIYRKEPTCHNARCCHREALSAAGSWPSVSWNVAAEEEGGACSALALPEPAGAGYAHASPLPTQPHRRARSRQWESCTGAFATRVPAHRQLRRVIQHQI